MALSILQSQAVFAPTITLASQPAATSVLSLFVQQANSASPFGVASLWSRITTGSPEEWRGTGPFSYTLIRLTAGRTPPNVDALIAEVG